MEGGNAAVVQRARSVVQAGIPVMGHIGLTPQSQSALGGYRVQGKTAKRVRRYIFSFIVTSRLSSVLQYTSDVERVMELYKLIYRHWSWSNKRNGFKMPDAFPSFSKPFRRL
jgi:hypothetical protein